MRVEHHRSQTSSAQKRSISNNKSNNESNKTDLQYQTSMRLLTNNAAWQILGLVCSTQSSDAWVSPRATPSPSRGFVGAQRSSALHVQPLSASPHNDENWIDATLHLGKTMIATASLAGVLMGSPGHVGPTSAWAESMLTEGSAPTAKLQGTVLDEAWTLVDKYFIDRSYGGQVRKDSQKACFLFSG